MFCTINIVPHVIQFPDSVAAALCTDGKKFQTLKISHNFKNYEETFAETCGCIRQT